MKTLAIMLNILTLLIVLYVVRAAVIIYDKRPDKNMTANDVFISALKDPEIVTHAYFTESKVGDIGEFEGFLDEDDELATFAEE